MSPTTIIFITVFIDLLGFGIIIPLMPFYAETFGANALTVGLLNTSFSLMQFLFAPFWGRLSDRVGRRPVILAGLAGSFVAYLLFGLAQSLALLFAARIAAGIAGANIPTAQAYMADVTTPENRARGMGLVGAAFGLGFVFGPAIGGFLSQWGYQAPSFFASGLSLVNLVAAWFLLPESRAAGGPEAIRLSRFAAFREALSRPRLPALLAIYFIVIAAFSSFELNFALYAGHRFGFTSTSIGYVFAFIGAVLSLVQGLVVGRAVKALGEHRVVPVAVAVLVAGMALVPLARTTAWLLAGCALLSIGVGLHSPSVTSAISRLSRATEQGGILGLAQAVASLARIIGPAWGGFLYDRFGATSPFSAAAGILAFALLLSLVTVAPHPIGRGTADS
jgi:multidrug resistance protein